MINTELTWDDQVTHITVKAAKRLWMLKKLKRLGFSTKELMMAYISFVRPVLEYGSVVWGPGITVDQARAIEAIQCRALQILCGKKLSISSTEYDNTLSKFNLEYLSERRGKILFKFGISLLKSDRFRKLLPPLNENTKSLRKQNFLQPIKCKNKRYQNSTIPTVTNMINEQYRQNGCVPGFH